MNLLLGFGSFSPISDSCKPQLFMNWLVFSLIKDELWEILTINSYNSVRDRKNVILSKRESFIFPHLYLLVLQKPFVS